MLEAQKPKSAEIKRVTVEAGALILFSEKGMHRIIPMREDIVRISYTEREKFSATVKPGVIAIPNEVNWKYEENDSAWRKRYSDRFFSSGDDDDEIEPQIQAPKHKTFEDLFKEV